MTEIDIEHEFFAFFQYLSLRYLISKVYSNVQLWILTLPDIYCLVTTVLSFSRGGYLEKAC